MFTEHEIQASGTQTWFQNLADELKIFKHKFQLLVYGIMHFDIFQTLTFFSCNLECRHYKCTKQHNNRRSSAVGNSHYLDMNRLFSDDLMIMTINIYILHIYLQWYWCRYSLKSANWNSSVFVYKPWCKHLECNAHLYYSMMMGGYTSGSPNTLLCFGQHDKFCFRPFVDHRPIPSLNLSLLSPIPCYRI